MSKHTPGRLFLSELPVGERDGEMAYAKLEIVAPSQDPRYLVFSVARIEFSYEQKHKGFISTSKEEAEANARRLVACWNACEGMATDVLEKIARTKAEATLADQQSADGGWIPWAGGECPVAHSTIVDVRLRNQGEGRAVASNWRWYHETRGNSILEGADIIAYRVVKP